ncbi:ArsO family NAD(P)H-dependent flavin-containing monooxygenase [Kitasatospora sp. NPDC051853]|uniref:ArsO family NAD(P)H-dependent flavin-containing monooxygenase n=1 Tax=Kitasatospora sp. NPDC051853 TaxID=3364058 RepID=UPI003788A0B3
MSAARHAQVLVVGAGQAGLAAGYHLRRAGLDFAVLDANPAPGGAWQHYWDTLRLFSPAGYSSLPGRPMPQQAGQEYPDAAHVVAYLTDYEKRYDLPVHRPVRVEAIARDADGITVTTDDGSWRSRAVLLATGNWDRPHLPSVPGRADFTGRQLHTHDYRTAADFAGQRVVVVGGANSGTQIAADLHATAEVRWVTQRPARYLPDDIDGRALFEIATRRVQAGGPRISDLGDIVAVPPVRAARTAGLTSRPMFDRLTPTGVAWADGTTLDCDTVIWCTGFRPDLPALDLTRTDGRIPTEGTRSTEDPRIHFLGYGDWTGPASATLIGVGRTARTAVEQLKPLL